MYLKAVEIAVVNEKVSNAGYNPSRCNVLSSGNLKCENIKGELQVDTSGQTPTTGQITFENLKVKNIKFYYDNVKVLKDDKGVYVLDNKYKIGQELTFDAGQGEENWYVIDEDKENITLLSKNNMTNGEWIHGDTCKTYAHKYFVKYIVEPSESLAIGSYSTNCGYVGPITLLTNINNEVSVNLNIEPIKDYEYINNNDESNKASYRKITIKDGKTVITDVDGEQIEIPGVTRARLLTIEDVLEISSEINRNFLEENLLNYLYDQAKIQGLTKEQADTLMEDYLKQNNIVERNWFTTLYYLAAKVISLEDAKDFVAPSFLTISGGHYYVLSTIDYRIDKIAGSSFISIQDLGNGFNKLDITPYNDNDYGYKYIITIKKDDIRIQ